ncbi:MAG: FAD-binding protein, partial [Muribaculaceae bacterium]|nr:FAD-binding protein [Muribaculaceae bacterium]
MWCGSDYENYKRQRNMRYDVLVIGAGLSGMTCAIALAQAGKRVAVLAPGSGTLPMHSGSFD